MNLVAPVAIVLAAGRGERAGTDTPKQLLPLLGQPVIFHALAQHARLGHRVIAVVSPRTRPGIEDLVRRELVGHGVVVVEGGATRRESVLAGLEALAAAPEETREASAVILRNAASPNTPDTVIAACIDGLHEHDAMQAYVASEETTFVRDGGRLVGLIPRSETGFTCDPTVYRRDAIDAIGAAMSGGESGETTLDIAVRLGLSIGVVECPRSNIKITTAEDLDRVAAAMGSDG